jgi:hypothetical protein
VHQDIKKEHMDYFISAVEKFLSNNL